jgi:TonB family protein
MGEREVAVEFEVLAEGKPTNARVVTSEAWLLESWAVQLVKSGQVKPGSPGVTQMADNKYHAKIFFPVENDGKPLSDVQTAPVVKIQAQPRYPFALRAKNISGGALLSLLVDEKARLKTVTLLKASHKEFGEAAYQAVKDWKFSKPGTEHGKPVAMSVNVAVVFELDGSKLAPWIWCVAPEPSLDSFLITGSNIPGS